MRTENQLQQNSKFRDSKAKIEQRNKILSELNLKKVTGPDKILPKIDNLSADIFDLHLTLQRPLLKYQVSENAEIASKPILKNKREKN